ncbi:MAG TPA: redox-regulated ATPase YchF, partial [Bacteroidetes bacterium]|nr:redox-regulated ATPase YchF [Bacteroidota bacterium]
NDLAIVERRLEKITRLHNADFKREVKILTHCQEMLSDQHALREYDFKPDEEKILRSYSFLSLKPLLIVLNLGEASVPDAGRILDDLKQETGLPERKTGWAAVAAGIESEINALEESDRDAFLNDLGFSLPALDRITRATFNLLGLVTFFTTSEKESRAWSIPAGSTAVQAAAAIHNDLARGFIRAEVCRWDELVEMDGSYGRLKETGKLRLEGRDYVVADGDVLLIRFNV